MEIQSNVLHFTTRFGSVVPPSDFFVQFEIKFNYTSIGLNLLKDKIVRICRQNCKDFQVFNI